VTDRQATGRAGVYERDEDRARAAGSVASAKISCRRQRRDARIKTLDRLLGCPRVQPSARTQTTPPDQPCYGEILRRAQRATTPAGLHSSPQDAGASLRCKNFLLIQSETQNHFEKYSRTIWPKRGHRNLYRTFRIRLIVFALVSRRTLREYLHRGSPQSART